MKGKYFLFVLVVLCGCRGNGNSPSPDVAAQTRSVAQSHNPALSSQIKKEIEYYLERHNPLDEGFEMVTRYAQSGTSTMRHYLPAGPANLAAMLRRHEGKIIKTDNHHRLFIGRLHADTLVSGLRIDSAGTYAGMMNRWGEASGHGTYRAADNSYYEGHWEHDQREGFGLCISPENLRVGVWRQDLFLGEHFTYHSDRIYGIDISRYQHERGRRHFPIDWNRLRVTHLGRRISQEQVHDTVDYPISFVYIKSTEGVTIENKYYVADDAHVRAQHIPVGAYHFFSTTSPAEEQAQHFLRNSHFERGDLPPMLDIEPSDKQIEAMGGPEALFNQARIWLRMVEASTGTRPLVYVNQRFVNTYLPVAPDLKTDYHFWIARYGEYKPDVHLDIWQLSGDGRVAGIRTEVDINVFNGYQGQWEQFLSTATIK